MTIDTPEQSLVRAYLATHVLGHGLTPTDGDCCSVGAINDALGAGNTDTNHPLVCPVLRALAIPLQDGLPLDLLRSPGWGEVVVRLVGSRSTPAVEQWRADQILGWMWDRLASIRDAVPASAQPAWDRMMTERTEAAAWAAAGAARAVWATRAAWAAREAAGAAAWAARAAAGAAVGAARAAAGAAGAAREAAGAARAAWAAAGARYWLSADPVGLLTRLIDGPALKRSAP